MIHRLLNPVSLFVNGLDENRVIIPYELRTSLAALAKRRLGRFCQSQGREKQLTIN